MTRRSRRERLGAVVLGVVVAVVGAVIVVTNETRAGPPKLTRPALAGFRGVVVLAEPADFLRADFGDHTARKARPPAGTFTHFPTRLVRRHGGFAFATDGLAFAARLRLEGPLTPLGPALDVLPAASEDRVWVVDPSRTTAREVDMHGHTIGPSRVLPVDGVPRAGVAGTPGTAASWLVEVGSHLEVRDVATGEVRRTVTSDGSLLDATATTALWRDTAGVHVTDLRTGIEHRLAAPPAGSSGYLDVGALAPGGHRAALLAAAESGLATLVVADLEVARAVSPTTTQTSTRSGVGSWSSDGTTLFFPVADSTQVFMVESGRTLDSGLPAAAALVVS